MIVLKKITVKNLLSYGNAPTSFDFTKSNSTLIRGKNGHGKSTLFLDAVIYALYGKPYRNINKPQLINSINKGDMWVELDFSIGIDNYQIKRGMKPNIFDIFKNGVLVTQDAATKDYQDFLEKNIIKIPEKTFKQIAILGASSYVPFMKLSSGQRRELVESILDIEVFSKMNAVLKERINSTKEELKTIDHKIELKKHEAKAQQKLINVIKENTSERVNEHKKSIELRTEEIILEQINTVRLNDKLKTLDETRPMFDVEHYESISLEISTLERKLDSNDSQCDKISSLDICPTCKQEVTEEHIDHISENLAKENKEISKKLKQLKQDLETLTNIREEYYEHAEKQQDVMRKIIEHEKNIITLNNSINDSNKAIQSILLNNSDIEEESNKLKTIGAAAVELLQRKNVLSEETHMQEIAFQLLKDTGIKTAVVKEYLPILNQLINQYLSMFNFFVDFTLNENFEEIVKSRGRDVFSYDSFSEGEKKRIDFSILMAFRQLASLKNSAKTNLLVFDELLDGALDLESKSLAQDVATNIEGANVIVVSHADTSNEGFERTILVEKVGDFSVYSEID